MPELNETKDPVMDRDGVAAFLADAFPQADPDGDTLRIEAVRFGGAHVRMIYQDRLIRPGGTISGPAMFLLADYSIYVALLATLGPVALAVTTNANINFLRRPAPADMIADIDIIKLGRRLAVAEARLRSDGSDAVVAHMTATYSIPPNAVK